MVFDPKEIMDVSVFLIKSQKAHRWAIFILEKFLNLKFLFPFDKKFLKLDIILEKFYYKIILLFPSVYKEVKNNERNKKSKGRKFLKNRQNAI